MNKVNDCVDYTLISLGTLIGLDNIESILGIIILSIQLLWFICKGCYKIYQLIKAKKFDKIEDVVDDMVDDIDGLKKGEKK